MSVWVEKIFALVSAGLGGLDGKAMRSALAAVVTRKLKVTAAEKTLIRRFEKKVPIVVSNPHILIANGALDFSAFYTQQGHKL